MVEDSEIRPDTTTFDSNSNSNKRKLDAGIELAKQRAQELAARLNSEAEFKRARVDSSHSSEPVLYPTSHPIPDGTQQFQPTANAQVGLYPYSAQPNQYYGTQDASKKKMSIPNNKVGVIIGKGGETIKYLQQQSGARIQITRDSEADPYATTRDVELSGTTEQVSRAEQLLNDVIAEADSGGSAPSSNRVLSLQPGADQVEMKVPNTKVSLLIGKGGETIKTIQSRSGARMQIVPLRLPPGDTSTERSVYISGLSDQIEAAKELVNEIVIEGRLRNPPVPSGYAQPIYTPPPQASLQQQQPQAAGYGYAAGSYPTQASYYGNYSAQQTGYDQSNPSAVAPQQNSSGYSYPTQQDHSGPVQPDPSYTYNQTNQSYNQGYSNQPSSYGQQTNPTQGATDQQNPYATTGYGASAPSAYPVPSMYPYSYNQQTPQAGYATPQSYYSQPLVYGQTGYPPNYSQGMNPPAYGQPESQAATQGAESNGNKGSGYSSPPAEQE